MNDLIERICADDAFPVTYEEIQKELDPKLYIGRCAGQVTEFVETVISPILSKYYVGDVSEDLKV